MNWRAIGIGVAIGLGGSMVLNVLFQLFPFDGERHPMWAILAISYGVGALIDIAAGATAGWLSARRGAMHGFLTGVIVSLVAPILGLAMMWVRERGELPIEWWPYLGAMVPGVVLGVVITTIAGVVAAAIASRQAKSA